MVDRTRFAVAHHVVDLMYEAVVATDRLLTIRFCNPAAERLFGIAAADLVGRPLADLVPIDRRVGHAARIADYLRSSLDARPMGARPRVTALRADGTVITCEVSIGATDDGELLFAVVRDVTELDRQEERQRSDRRERHLAESRFVAIIEDSPNAIVIVGADDLHIVYDNPAARHLYGSALLADRFDAATLVGVSPADDAPRIVRAFERLAAGDADRVGLRLAVRHPEWDSVRVVDLAITRLHSESATPELLLRAVDVADRS